MCPMVLEQRVIDIKHFYEGNPLFGVFWGFKGFLSIKSISIIISVIAEHFLFLQIGCNFLLGEY